MRFEGEEPNHHSACNHVHLWGLEYWAERCPGIDLSFRLEFVEEIFRQWRAQLRGLPPFQTAGYRLYLYEDLAPTVSVVAETPAGFPYEGGAVEFVGAPAEVMAGYLRQKWSDNFKFTPWPMPQTRILSAIEAHAGSISKPTANALGVGVGELRQLIETMGLEQKVNALRKRFRRRPATFRPALDLSTPRKIYERRLPPQFD
ncbi:MAG: hypothetical protein CTY15_06700 [Methylocystis sp.]|nr:MAG: hypothetical protein CTY15_06700 [Methylocystis sp.]